MSPSNGSGLPFYDVVVKEESPFVNVARTSNGNVTYSGLIIDLLKEMSRLANFDYNIKLVNHKSYGHQSHGRWDGLISEIPKGSADIAAGPIPCGVKESGNSIVDFTKQFMSTRVNLLVKYPPEAQRGMNLIFQPYKAEVWVMLCLAFIAVSLALFLIGRFSPFEWARLTKEKEYRTYRKIFELKNSFFFAATTISLQGYKEAPRSTAGRILACMWFMFVMSVLLAYTASLASILTTRTSAATQRLPFSGYDDLLKNKQVKLGAIKYDYIYSAMGSSNLAQDEILSRILSYVENSNEWIQDVDAGIQRVKDFGGKYALVMQSAKASHVAMSNCDLMNYGENLLTLGYSFAVAKNSQLRDRLNLSILTLRENGAITKLIKKYLWSGHCPVHDSSKIAAISNPAYSQTASGLDMKDMAIPFLFLFLGILGAGGALAGEIYYKKKMNSKKEGDPKEREPLNVEAGVSRAPKTSPPPPPIYKVNNKLHETAPDGDKSEPLEKASIEVVIVDKKNEVDKEIKGSNEMDKESAKASDGAPENSINSVDQEDDS